MGLVEYSVCLVVIGYVLGRVCKRKKDQRKQHVATWKKKNLIDYNCLCSKDFSNKNFHHQKVLT